MKKLCTVLATLLVSGAMASAGVITYTETVTATGTFEGTPFTDQTVTLSETADTSGITGAGTYELIGPTTVTVSGIGTATFLDQFFVFSCQECSDGGFFDSTLEVNVLFNDNPAFATYDLSTPIGPLTGTASIDETDTFSTTGGDFALTSGDLNATFQASGATGVPEPGTLSLLGIGLAAAVAVRRRAAH